MTAGSLHQPRDVVARVTELRRARGISAQSLAEQAADHGCLTLTRAVLANWETGRRQELSVSELIALARVLQVSVEWLATGAVAGACRHCHDQPPASQQCSHCRAIGWGI